MNKTGKKDTQITKIHTNINTVNMYTVYVYCIYIVYTVYIYIYIYNHKVQEPNNHCTRTYEISIHYKAERKHTKIPNIIIIIQYTN